MILHLTRYRPEYSGCLGMLRIDDGGLECFTLEPADGAHRVPAGDHPVSVASGGRLGGLYRHLGYAGVLQVPGWRGGGIDIHGLEFARHTHRCILVGHGAYRSAGGLALNESHAARDELYQAAMPFAVKGGLRIVITEGG